MEDRVVKHLRSAIDGLTFVSERDAPFEVFDWGKWDTLNLQLVRKLGGHPKCDSVTETEFRPFFDALTESQDWHGEEEKEQVRKYRNLLTIFEKELTGLAIYCVGDVNVTYYIVGRSPSGHWIGVKTEATET